jgi:uncharacterized protein YkwD
MAGSLLGIAAISAPTTAVAAPAAPSRAAAVVELLNETRADRGLAPLRFDRRLARSALRHSRDMVANHYFAHDSRSGARFSARIARTGWMRGRGRWRVGETLAWGVGDHATPAPVVRAWLRSPSHRRIVLSPGFTLVGAGIVPGTPFRGRRAGRTYTADFGS